MSETTLVCDVETDGLLPELTRIWVLTVGDPHTGKLDTYADQPGYTPLAEGLARISRAERVVAHHGIGFDWRAIEKLYPGTLRFDQMWDTLVAMRLLDPENRAHALGDWGRRLGIEKPEHEDWSQFSEEMVHRNREDVRINIEVFKRAWRGLKAWGPKAQEALEIEFKVALVIALQESNGFTLDVPAAIDLEGELRQEQDDIERELQTVFTGRWCAKVNNTGVLFPGWHDLRKAVKVPKVGRIDGKTATVKDAAYTPVEFVEFNPKSRRHVEAWMRATGWKPTKFTDGGAAKLDETTINDIAVVFPKLKPLARFFRVTKQLGQLADGDNAWLRLVTPEGRVHGRVNPNGCRTHRMTHFAPNMGQVDKKDKRMRAVWIPRKDWVLVGCDAEGLEERELSHYLHRYDGGAYGKAVVEGKKEDGTDAHTLAQKAIGLFDRDQAKRVKYAFFYGAGDAKLGSIVIEDADLAGKPRPKGAASTLGKAARASLSSGITGLGELIVSVQKAHRKSKYLVTHDGRRVKTTSDHSALNTLLQSGGSIVMKQALAIWHFEMAPELGLVSSDFLTCNNFAYVVNVHDEQGFESSPEIAETIGKGFAECITEAGRRFNLRCPMSGAYDIGISWEETH